MLKMKYNILKIFKIVLVLMLLSAEYISCNEKIKSQNMEFSAINMQSANYKHNTDVNKLIRNFNKNNSSDTKDKNHETEMKKKFRKAAQITIGDKSQKSTMKNSKKQKERTFKESEETEKKTTEQFSMEKKTNTNTQTSNNTAVSKCFTTSYKEYISNLRVSINVLGEKCKVIADETVKAFVSTYEGIAKIEIWQKIAETKITGPFIKSIQEQKLPQSTVDILRTTLDPYKSYSIDTNQLVKELDEEVTQYLKSANLYDSFSHNVLMIYKQSKMQFTKLNEFITIKDTDETTCLPTDWVLITTFDTNEEYYKFFWSDRQCEEKSGEITIDVHEKELMYTLSFWTQEDQIKMIKQVTDNEKENQGGVETFLTETQIKASKVNMYNIFMGQNRDQLTYEYNQIFDKKGKIENIYNWKNGYDFTEGIPQNDGIIINPSTATCKQWNFNVLHITRECDYYQMIVLQKSPGIDKDFEFQFKLPVKDFLGGRIVVNTTQGINYQIKFLPGMKYNSFNVVQLMYSDTTFWSNNQLTEISPCPIINRCTYVINGRCYLNQRSANYSSEGS